MKTYLCVLKPKYNVRTEFGIKRNKRFIALQDNGGCRRLRQSSLPHPYSRARVGYREIWDLAGFYRNCVYVASLVPHAFKVVPGC